MEIVRSIINALLTEYSLLGWYDLIEISFFIMCTSYWLHWLNTDKNKNLAILFCCYSCITIGSYYIELTTISTLLLTTTPLIWVLFILMHQEQLQRNFISLAARHTLVSAATSWLSEFISFAFSMLHKHQETIYIIERHHNLSLLLTSPCVINAPATKDLLELLTQQGSPTATNLWMSSEGIIIGINSSLTVQPNPTNTTPEAQRLPRWQQEALLITSKSDALVLHGSPLTHSFDIIVEGKILEHMSPQQTVTLLQRLIHQPSDHKGTTYAPSHQQRPPDQLHY